MIYMIIDEYRGRLSVERACELMDVSRSAYHSWRRSGATDKSGVDDELAKEIEAITLEFAGYGYRRVTQELHRRGYGDNHKRVQRIMQEKNLTRKKRRRKVKTTDSTHGLPTYPNLAKDFIPTGINQLWIADITYIRLKYEFVYLAAILDAFSRKTVGWALRDFLTHELALAALRMALARRDIKPGLIHHSDQGVQYACKDYVEALKQNKIVVSMSRVGNPYDNAMAESFMATLKKEEVYLYEYDDIFEALSRIGYFIEDVYNHKRLHSSLGYMSPDEFERMHATTLVTVD